MIVLIEKEQNHEPLKERDYFLRAVGKHIGSEPISPDGVGLVYTLTRNGDTIISPKVKGLLNGRKDLDEWVEQGGDDLKVVETDVFEDDFFLKTTLKAKTGDLLRIAVNGKDELHNI